MSKLLIKMIKSPWVIIGVTLIVTVLFFFVMKDNSRMETDLDKYMPKSHPAFIYSDKAEEIFGINDGIIVAVENQDGIFNTETLDTLKQLTKALQNMEQINKGDVTSLYTADNIVGTEDGMDVKRFFKRVPKSKEKLEALRKNVLSNEMIYGKLVSENEKVAIVIAEIGDDVFSQEFYYEILDLAKRYQNDKIKIHVAGRPIVEGEMALLGPKDMKKMVPIVILVIALVLFLILRSVKSTLLTLGVVFFSTIWAFGLMALLKIPVYAVSTMIPVMLIAIGVAYSVHLYNHLQLFINKNPEATKKEAVVDMIKAMWKPVMIAAVTTAVGFVSLLTSQVFPIKYFGLFTAFGVAVAWILSVTFIPAGIMAFGLPKRRAIKERNDNESFLYKFAAKVLKRKSLTIIITSVIVVLSIIGMQKIWINSSFLDKFEKDSNIVMTDRFINENFGGTTMVNLILDAGENPDAFKNPELLRLTDEMQKRVVKELKVVGNSFSLTDFIDRMNKVMHSDDETFNKIPNSKEMVAQYLLLYEMSGDPENLNKVVNYDYTKLNVTFQLKSDNSKAINSALDILKTYEKDFKKYGVTMNYAGSGYKGLVFTDLILEGQVMSLILSLIIVILLLALMFKSFKAGLLGSVPIVITALISFGVMGFLNIPLNTTTALLSSIAIGIGIDYAVHFIEQYKNFARETNQNMLLTAKKTMANSGRAIIYNAIVVIAGFMVLLFSVFPPNRELGALVSLNMFTSFAGTLTILLVLLSITKMYSKKDKEKK
ncbi:MAG: RND family transporter [Bacteroidales bacterium]|nr:RND family transporter [Bacteroidales bacterium]